MNAKKELGVLQGFDLRATLSTGLLEKSLKAGRLPAQGELLPKELPRLAESVLSVDSPIQWSFAPEDQQGPGGRRCWRLLARATVSCTCERCLMPVSEALHASRGFEFFATAALADAMTEESLADGPQGTEGLAEVDYLSPEDGMSLALLIEDELLLNLPMAPKHADCRPPLQALGEEGLRAANSPDEPETARPLAGLKDLLKKS